MWPESKGRLKLKKCGQTHDVEGVHEVAGKIYDDLYSGVLSGKKQNTILKDLIMARLVNPCSKHKSQKILENQFNFEGNKAEVKTLIASIEAWSALFNIENVCFVGDRAMMSKSNIELLENRGYQYIVAAKLRSLPTLLRQDILNKKQENITETHDNLSWMGEFQYNTSRLVVSYKQKCV